MDVPKIMSQEDLEKLLERYYEGDTSPQEEILLHLALLDEPLDSPFKKDLFVLEHMMKGAQQISNKKKTEIFLFQKRFYIPLLSVAASVLLLLFFFIPSTKQKKSYINGVPLAQEEVEKHANEAFDMLFSSIEEGASQCNFLEAKLERTNNILDHSFENMQDPIEDSPFILTRAN